MDWDEMARPWLIAAPDLEIAFAEIFAELFGAAQLCPGEKVLDVGCGTGPTLLTASNAVGETGQVFGVDIAPPLLARAAERVPGNVTLAVGDAGTYAFAPTAFDAIIANFGIMFFEDTSAALRNLRSAVPKGGRLAATVWATPQENPWFSLPRQIIDAHVQDVPRPDLSGPGPMRFGDPENLEVYLSAAGWDPDIRSVNLDLVPPSPISRMVDLHMSVTVGMMLKGMDVSDAVLAQIRQALTDASKVYETADGLRVPAKIHVVSAVAV